MRFKDKVAIITGSGTGIGRDMAIAFAQEGARVALAARREHLLQETADLAERAGIGRARCCRPGTGASVSRT